jgi:DNA helicase-2/ATP-dependent DNA helicase PcrA
MKALEDMNNVEGDSRLENLLEFRTVIEDYQKEGGDSLPEFLEKIALLSDIDNHDPSENAVVLMTLHSAKGLEFPFVFMPGMEDGLFPGWRAQDSPDGLEEERRLCYVGITRAKERLCMTSASYRTLYGKGSYTRESTFLREMDPKLLVGDGVFQKREEVMHGRTVQIDGYSNPEPYRPFGGNIGSPYDRMGSAKLEVHAKKKAPVALASGDKVFHNKFGEGLVIEVSGNVVSVMFDKVGLKKLAADIAPLKKL